MELKGGAMSETCPNIKFREMICQCHGLPIAKYEPEKKTLAQVLMLIHSHAYARDADVPFEEMAQAARDYIAQEQEQHG